MTSCLALQSSIPPFTPAIATSTCSLVFSNLWCPQPTFSFVVPPGAGLGTTLTVQAPNGQTVQVAVPPGTSPGASLTVAMPPAPVVASQPAPIQGMVVSEPPPSYAESGPLEGTVVSEPESLSAPGEVNHKGLIVARVVS